ncbi:uncharacterized protein A1O5_06166 [Cladophialophora psammophila CBS 110553]|uniref:Uncharacterized protein n=1 Tax=Cladophialophora psammophila CBS 110553 TaxID=1182543 RepID=W9WSI7_9EURO|nr:uncharacterized protein A1O5_06166 [Cladophialophora psammophila CBS 110553]EXJ71172.1 hypothetical protein A1O5_06166 [Cladophialophora psammophila CBS 110553]
MTRKRHEVLPAQVSREEFVDDFRRFLSEVFQDVIDEVSGRLNAALEQKIEAIKSDLKTVRPSKGNERLVKADPEYGEQSEAVLLKVTQQLEEVDELAANTREMARQRYT